MKAYSYDYNGKFLSVIECEKDPINEIKRIKNPKLPVKYLIPASATIIKPVIPANHEAIFNGKTWEYQEIKPITTESKEPEKPIPYNVKRLWEYPSANDYLDGVIKTLSGNPSLEVEGHAQIKKYISDCLAVKAKYPKD